MHIKDSTRQVRYPAPTAIKSYKEPEICIKISQAHQAYFWERCSRLTIWNLQDPAISPGQTAAAKRYTQQHLCTVRSSQAFFSCAATINATAQPEISADDDVPHLESARSSSNTFTSESRKVETTRRPVHIVKLLISHHFSRPATINATAQREISAAKVRISKRKNLYHIARSMIVPRRIQAGGTQDLWCPWWPQPGALCAARNFAVVGRLSWRRWNTVLTDMEMRTSASSSWHP